MITVLVWSFLHVLFVNAANRYLRDPRYPQAAETQNVVKPLTPWASRISKEECYQTMFLAVEATFKDPSFLKECKALRMSVVYQSNSCMYISDAIKGLTEMRCPVKNPLLEELRQIFGSLKLVKIERDGWHVSLRNMNGDILDFQGFMKNRWNDYKEASERKTCIPRLIRTNDAFSGKLKHEHFYAKRGYHKSNAQYLFYSHGKLAGKTMLMKETLNLIDKDLQFLPIESRLMDDQLVVSIMASPKSWKAVKQETGIEISYADDEEVGEFGKVYSELIRGYVLRHYTFFRQNDKERKRKINCYQTSLNEEIRVSNTIKYVREYVREKKKSEKEKEEIERLRRQRVKDILSWLKPGIRVRLKQSRKVVKVKKVDKNGKGVMVNLTSGSWRSRSSTTAWIKITDVEPFTKSKSR